MASPTALLLILSSFVLTHVADGCLALSDKGVLGVNNEVAVIIWDKSHQTEHFIRSVSLDSKSNTAGFLVPTPTTPELAVADEHIFDLAESYLPITRSLSKALGKAFRRLSAKAIPSLENENGARSPLPLAGLTGSQARSAALGLGIMQTRSFRCPRAARAIQ